MPKYSYSVIGSAKQQIEKKYLYAGTFVVIWLVALCLFLLFFSIPGSECVDNRKICSWRTYYAHTETEIQAVALRITPGNRMIRPPNPLQAERFQQEMINIDNNAMNGFCDLFEKYYESLGVNGLIAALRDYSIPQGIAGFRSTLARIATLGDSGAGDPPSGGDSMTRHLIGGWAYDKMHRLNHTEREVVEAVGSLELVGAPLHAVVWQAMSRMKPEDDLWGEVIPRFCYFSNETAVLFVHCLHGMGHGVLFVALPPQTDNMQKGQAMDSHSSMNMPGMSSKKTENSCGNMVMEDVLAGTTEQSLALAIELCGKGPTKDMQYICSAGVYMSFFNGDHSAQPSGWQLNVCDASPYSAPCFRFLLEHMSEEDGIEVCKTHAFATSMQKRGCIYAQAHRSYLTFDTSSSSPTSLVDKCRQYYLPLTSNWDPREWLSCVAGGMASVAFLMESGSRLPQWLVVRHCEQLLSVDNITPTYYVVGGSLRGGITKNNDSLAINNATITLGEFARQACIGVGTSRRATTREELLVWRTDILED